VIWAMAEIEGVAQFMDRFLDNPVEKYVLRVYGREVFFESTGGYDAGSPTQLCFSVNMGENRDKEVHMGYRKRL
jgi:hypothetical protein